MTGRIVSHWTDGPEVATCLECGTPFAGVVCPNCRQRLEARDLPSYASPEECLDRLTAEAGPDVVAGAFDRPEVTR